MEEMYKGYKIKADGKFNFFYIKAKGSGKVPKQLTSAYTTKEYALKAVDTYLGSLKKGTKYGKSKTASRTS